MQNKIKNLYININILLRTYLEIYVGISRKIRIELEQQTERVGFVLQILRKPTYILYMYDLYKMYIHTKF